MLIKVSALDVVGGKLAFTFLPDIVENGVHMTRVCFVILPCTVIGMYGTALYCVRVCVELHAKVLHVWFCTVRRVCTESHCAIVQMADP